MISKLNKIFPLAIVLIFGLAIGFEVAGPYLFDNTVIQDDFRQTNFWFWRFWDPGLFVNDYFAEQNSASLQRLAPLYLLIWRLMPLVTNNLIFASKLYAILLSALSTLAAYLFINKLTQGKNIILSLSFAFAMAVTFWCTDHLPAAHVRSSIWLILFIYMWLKESKQDTFASGLCTIALFYNPTAFLLCMGMEGFAWFLSIRTKIFTKSFYFLIINSLLTISYHFLYHKGVQYSGEGARLTHTEMKSLPEFNLGGRHPIFGSNIWDGSWWNNEHWGLGIGYLAISKVIIIGLLLAITYFILIRPKATEIKTILVSSPLILLYSSLLLYLSSTLVFPLLYFPSRYLAVSSLLLGVLSLFLCSYTLLSKFISSKQISYTKIFPPLLALIFWLCSHQYYHARYISVDPAINEAVSALPIDSLIAGHPIMGDLTMLSATAKRKVFIDRERSIAFTMKSINEIRRRNKVALAMTYAKSKEEFISLANENGITHFLAAYPYYSPEYLNKSIKYHQPYNGYIEGLIYPIPSQGFFVESILEQQRTTCTIIDLSK